MPPSLLVQSRKERRKQKRKGGGKRATPSIEEPLDKPARHQKSVAQKRKNVVNVKRKDAPQSKALQSQPSNKKAKRSKRGGVYDRMDAETAMAIKREDAEIKELEAKLGLADRKEKKRLHKEYAREEGYGDDFGDFLDDLDKMVERLDDDSSKAEEESSNDDIDDHDDDDDDDSSSSEDDDDDSSCDDEDSNNDRKMKRKEENKSGHDREETSESDVGDNDDGEEVPMAPPANDAESDNQDDESSSQSGDESNDDASDSGSVGSREKEPDHDVHDTYRPRKGEDIYGNAVDDTTQSTKPTKYLPPHLRKQKEKDVSKNNSDNDDKEEEEDDKKRQESLKTIRRSLNNALNRLSEDTLITVSQSIARLYPSHPTTMVNECIWENTRNACVVARSHLMTGLTPLYAAALVGVHVQKGDAAQLGEHLIEMAVTDLMQTLAAARAKSDDDEDNNDSLVAKQAGNLVLLLCCLYNLDVVHCRLIYDVVRDLIKSFQEVDIELLLIILSHCGRSLRSDDPSALKSIVLDVQSRVLQQQQEGGSSSSSSRVDYMVSAVMDLKNNKKRQQDVAHGEKTAKLRKLIGRIKSLVAASNGNVRCSDSSLRITMKDILEAEERGRWWRIGASWEGNQYAFRGDEDTGDGDGAEAAATNSATRTASKEKLADDEDQEREDKLLRLAAKYRMNTDTRRSIFCIIMGSADFEDAFEKLVRAGMLTRRKERDTARVLMECCGNEKTFNNFYAHLAKRICEYQSQSKFTVQLAYWDFFKQFEGMKHRKAANLAKLLFALVVQHRVLKLNVLKGIDMTSPDDLSETGMIFLTVFFTNVMEHFDDPSDVSLFFESGVNHRFAEKASAEDSNEFDHADEAEALYASLTLFFVQVLKSSPKYAKGTKFRANLKAAIKSCDADNFFV